MLMADHWHGGPGPWFLVWFLAILLLWAIVIFMLSRVWRRGWWGPRRPWDHDPSRSAHAVLAERYARGEINETEYRERRSVIREGEG